MLFFGLRPLQHWHENHRRITGDHDFLSLTRRNRSLSSVGFSPELAHSIKINAFKIKGARLVLFSGPG